MGKNMETNGNYAVVGGFVILLFSAIILGIIWLSSGFTFRYYATYLTYMQEPVSGLGPDSAVEYNGVNVGSVQKIELNAKNPELVEVALSIDNTTPITRGTTASINSRGLTGFTFVALKDQGTDLKPLVREKGQPYPVIPTSARSLRLETAMGELSKNFQHISESIDKLLNEENLTSFKNILLNLQKFTATLAENNERFNLILENTAKASEAFGPLLQSTTGAFRTLELQTLPSAYQVILNLDEITRSLSETASQLRQNPSVLIRGTENQQLGPGESK